MLAGCYDPSVLKSCASNMSLDTGREEPMEYQDYQDVLGLHPGGSISVEDADKLWQDLLSTEPMALIGERGW